MVHQTHQDYPQPAHKIFLPSGRFEASDLPGQDDTLVIMANHLASSVDGDSGRKAQAAADRTGYAVLAYDRPGSTPGTSLKVTPDNDLEIARWTGSALFRRVDSEGFNHVVLAGNSAAATAVISLARSETLPVSHLVTMDPIGTERNTIPGGLLKWLAFGIRELRHPSLDRPEDDRPDEAVGFKLPAFVHDSSAYGKLWASTEAISNLRFIASNCGQIAIRACWPERTFTASSQTIEKLAVELPRLRGGLAPPYELQQITTAIEDGSHAQFENFRTYANHVAWAIQPDFDGFQY